MRKPLVLSLLALVLLLVFLGGYILSARYQRTEGAPAYRQGYGLSFLPPGLAALLCRASEAPALCLRGYFQARIPQGLEGLPEAPCRGLSGTPGQVCSEVVGLRLVYFPSSVKLCNRLPDPEACARYVGRGVYARKGMPGVREECPKVQGPLLSQCYLGASMEMVEREGPPSLGRAWSLCERGNPDGTLCAPALASALLSRVRKEEALKGCTALPPLQAGRCVVAVQGAR